MTEFIEFLLKQFVNKPDEVKITQTNDGEFTVYNIKVADEDMGVVIGREGKTINSLRNLVRAKAIKDNVMAKIVLEDTKLQPTATTADA